MAAPDSRRSIIRLKVGEKYSIRLKGLGAAGYDWDYTIEDDANAIQVARDASGQQQGGSASNPPVAPRSSSVEDVFRIHAVAVGSATVHFTQSRSWEKGKRPPLNESVVQVNVTD